jgi:hypothetical protein
MKFRIENYGYSKNDFEVLHGQGEVYVTYNPTGFRRMYDEATWEEEFEEDLKNKIFTS